MNSTERNFSLVKDAEAAGGRHTDDIRAEPVHPIRKIGDLARAYTDMQILHLMLALLKVKEVVPVPPNFTSLWHATYKFTTFL